VAITATSAADPTKSASASITQLALRQNVTLPPTWKLRPPPVPLTPVPLDLVLVT
jgi:hypothetical protein